MEAIIRYTLEVSAVMVVFYTFYRLLLSKDSFLRVNRGVLIATTLLAFTLPLCVITTTEIITIDKALEHTISPIVEQATQLTLTTTQDSINWGVIVLIVYSLGVLVVLGHTIYSLILVKQIVSKSRRAEHSGSYRLYVTEQKITPFSWFNSVVICEDDYQNAEERDIILSHEEAHIALRHSYDLLFMSLCCAIQWFNPAAWIVKNDLKDIHEYEADRKIIRSGYNAQQYQLLLIKKAIGGKSYSTTNSLNHSTLKKRITMMLKKKSRAVTSLKLLYIVPLVALSLNVFSQTTTLYEEKNPTTDKVTQNPQTPKLTLYLDDSVKQKRWDEEVTNVTAKSIDKYNSTINLAIDEQGNITTEQGKVSFKRDIKALERYLSEKLDGKKHHTVEIGVDPKARLGTVTDVRQTIRRVNLSVLKRITEQNVQIYLSKIESNNEE